MKKIMSILACVAVVLSACQKEEMPSLSFETATYVMGADDAVTVKVVVSAAPAADLAVAFTTSGSAVLGTDYELSAESIIIKAGETAGEVVVSPKNNLGADLNITLTLTLASGYQAGNFVSANIALGSKEKVAYSFAKQESKLINEVDVTLNLIGLASGANFTAGGNYELPFVIDAASTAVAGTDFEVKGGATAFVFEKGAKSATITLVAKKEITEGSKEIIVKLDEAAIAAVYGDRFSAGVIAATKAILTKGLIFSDLEGKWAYASTPILDDPEADCWTFGAMLEEAGDGGFNEEFTGAAIIGFPTATASDVLEFKYVDGKASLVPSGTGSVLEYFRTCEVSGFIPGVYNWYYYDNTNGLGRAYNVTEIALSKANVNYSKTSASEKAAKIKVCLSEDGKILHVFITEYTPTDFFVNSYMFYSMLEMWADMAFYFDIYYTFTKVAE